MQSLFARLSGQYALTSIFVTHDIREALVVGSRFARMSAGALQVYANRHEFVADAGTGIPDEIAFWNAIGDSSDAVLRRDV